MHRFNVFNELLIIHAYFNSQTNQNVVENIKTNKKKPRINKIVVFVFLFFYTLIKSDLL